MTDPTGGLLSGLFGYPTLGDARNAGMEAQCRNADAYRAAHQSPPDPALLQNAWTPTPYASPQYAGLRALKDSRAYLSTPDWLWIGWLVAMFAGLVLRWLMR